MTGIQSLNLLLLRFRACQIDLFALPECASKTTSKKHRKKCENQGFWPPQTLPKPIQNASKNEVPKNIDFFEVFCHMFFMFVIFETLKISIFPRENRYFQGFH